MRGLKLESYAEPFFITQEIETALIATGFGFAALKPDGRPVHAPYFVAQLVAQRARVGLWAFPDMPEPNAIIVEVSTGFAR